MRILYLIHQFMPEFAAGTENVTLSLAKAAQSAGHHVEVLTASVGSAEAWSGEDDEGLRWAVIDGIPVTGVPSPPMATWADHGFRRDEGFTRTVSRFLDARPDFDVVHVTHCMRMLAAVELVDRLGVPYIMTVTDFFLPCYRITLMRADGSLCEGPQGGEQCLQSCPIESLEDSGMYGRLARTRGVLQNARSVSAPSRYLADTLERSFPEVEVQVIAHGIDLLQFDYRGRRGTGGGLVFGYLGTLSEAKGVHLLVEAFSRAAPVNAKLELFGPGYVAEYNARLAGLVASDPRVALMGPIAAGRRPSTLSRFSVLCLPSLWPETFSLVMHEGFAAGVPCLVSPLGEPAAFVRRSGCGRVVDTPDIEGWAAAIADAARSPHELDEYRARIPPPVRTEEEGFIYDQLYRQAVASDRRAIA